MKNLWIRMIVACASAAVFIASSGCASTPDSRIRAQPELFAGFPADVQAKIREGRIELGFTPAMVELAMGSPYRRAVRQTAAGTVEVWQYCRLEEQVAAPEFVPVQTYVRGRGGYLYSVPDFMWVDRSVWRERVYLRVDFEKGVVSGIETSAP